jgi:hypothetical protein
MERRQLEFKTVGDQAFLFDPRTGATVPVPGVQPKPPEAIRTNAIKADQAYRNLSTALNDYEGLVKRIGATGATLPGQGSDAVMQARTNIMLQLKELYNLGVLNGPDYELMQNMIPDPSIGITGRGPWGLLPTPTGVPNLLPGNAAARTSQGVARLREMLRTIRNNALGAAGMQPQGGQQQRVRTYNPATGELEDGGFSIRRLDDPLGIR